MRLHIIDYLGFYLFMPSVTGEKDMEYLVFIYRESNTIEINNFCFEEQKYLVSEVKLLTTITH